jgi:hypothetical protein
MINLPFSDFENPIHGTPGPGRNTRRLRRFDKAPARHNNHALAPDGGRAGARRFQR